MDWTPGRVADLYERADDALARAHVLADEQRQRQRYAAAAQPDGEPPATEPRLQTQPPVASPQMT